MRVRIAYSGNAGSAELEAVVVRGTQRPETTDVYVLPIRLEQGQRNRLNARQIHRKTEDAAATLRALQAAGRKVVAMFGETAVTGQVIGVQVKVTQKGEKAPPTRYLEVRFRKVVTS